MNGSGLDGAGGYSTFQPLSTSGQPYQPQNQPSREAAASRIITAAPSFTGLSFNRSGTRQAAAGVALYISLTMIAPSGTGGVLAAGVSCPIGRYLRSHATISGEYQISTGIWVPYSVPVYVPLFNVAMNGPASRTV